MNGTATAEAAEIRLPADERSGHDNRLVLRAQAGDRAAFAELYQAHAGGILAMCLRMLRNTQDAADATSEAFVVSMERIGDLREAGAFSGWLRTIARHAALRRIAERRRTCEMPEGLDARVPDTSPASDPAEAAERRETSDLLAEAAATMNPRYRRVYDLHVRQGWDAGRIAESLGITTPHAYVLVSRIKETLREALRALVIAHSARASCKVLQAIVSEFGTERSPRMREAILRHIRRCPTCSAREVPSLLTVS